MPSWVLLLSADSLKAVQLEDEIRLAGFSPRRAPDVARAEVLLGQGERPAAVVVDLASIGEASFEALRGLQKASRDARIVALSPDPDGPLATRADETGVHVLSTPEAESGQLSKLLQNFASD